MQHLVRDCFRGEGYRFATGAFDIARACGWDRVARLGSNESPYPPSPLAIARATEALASANRYPDEHMVSLVESLRRAFGDYSFVTGAGMDGVIETVIRATLDAGDRVAISTPTFSFYGIAARAQGGVPHPIPRTGGFAIDAGRVIAESRGAKITFLCTPNNPTGNATPPEVIGEICDGIEGMLFLDNAYVEFAALDYMPLLRRFDNLIIGRTFSKAYALAGLRVGFACVPSWFEPLFRRAQTPFALNAVSAAAAMGALADTEHVRRIVAHVTAWRRRFTAEIPFPVLPSDANFVLVDVSPLTGDEAVEALARRGVVVRSAAGFPGLGDHFIRASIGDYWENERFIEEIQSI
ncbi:MAG: aminotransferase class I/II-fold pyridoxal phosphate-dependent enzyme [Methanomicrobiaceae archaeon]|nr:aminotransferase class I/II-fold pyridoxal phosphate-dependent enzyme [Methanomicrobiaceae archaeon]